MSISVEDYVDVNVRARELGYEDPTEVVLLPRNFDSAPSSAELIEEGNTATVRILFREAGFPDGRLKGSAQKHPVLKQKSLDWISPILFFAAAALNEKPDLISNILDIIKSHLAEFFKGQVDEPQVKLDIVVETTKSRRHKRIHYEGNAEGLKSIPQIVEKVRKDE